MSIDVLTSDRVYFSPGIYEHAASLIGESPWTVSRDAGLLCHAQSSAWKLYQHPILVAGIDVYNVEPEAFGAELDRPSGEGVPSIISHPVDTVESLLQLEAPNLSTAGRMPMILDAAQRLAATCKTAEVFVPVCGPLAFANGLVGMDEVLCTMMEAPSTVREALRHLSRIQSFYVRAIFEAGARPLIFESGASPPLLPPNFFSEIEAPALACLFSYCQETGGTAPACILGGDVLPILPDLLALRPGFLICPSETDQAAFVEVAAASTRTAVRVNMPVSSLFENDWTKTLQAADRAFALASRLAKGSVGTGVVPFNTSPDALLRLRDHVNLLHYQ